MVRCLLDVARTSALTPSLICSNRKTHGFQGKLLFGPLFDVDPESLIDQPVRVFWEGEKKFFQGTVIAFDANTWKHTVRRLDPPCRMAVGAAWRQRSPKMLPDPPQSSSSCSQHAIFLLSQVVYDDGDQAEELLILQVVQFPKAPVDGADTAWPAPTAEKLEALGSFLSNEAEKGEKGAAAKASGTKRTQEVAAGSRSGEGEPGSAGSRSGVGGKARGERVKVAAVCSLVMSGWWFSHVTIPRFLDAVCDPDIKCVPILARPACSHPSMLALTPPPPTPLLQ